MNALHSFETSALLLRRTDYGESDLVLNVLTDAVGRIGVIARGARASKRRFSGGIEPFHGLHLHLDAPRQGDLYRLRDTRLETPRSRLVTSLVALNIAARGLAWVRDSLAPGAPDPGIFEACRRFLDRLDESPPATLERGRDLLGDFGLLLLTSLGWALQLEQCVRCGRACPANSAATIDPRRGGVVCRRCGGGPYLISALLRQRLIAASRGETTEDQCSDPDRVLDIVEATLLAHPGVESL